MKDTTMRDTTNNAAARNVNPARPYFSEGTAAIAALVATSPAADVLRAVAHELSFRSRPAAVRLLADVTARLAPTAAPAPVKAAPVVTAKPTAKAPRARRVAKAAKGKAAPAAEPAICEAPGWFTYAWKGGKVGTPDPRRIKANAERWRAHSPAFRAFLLALGKPATCAPLKAWPDCAEKQAEVERLLANDVRDRQRQADATAFGWPCAEDFRYAAARAPSVTRLKDGTHNPAEAVAWIEYMRKAREDACATYEARTKSAALRVNRPTKRAVA